VCGVIGRQRARKNPSAPGWGGGGGIARKIGHSSGWSQLASQRWASTLVHMLRKSHMSWTWLSRQYYSRVYSSLTKLPEMIQSRFQRSGFHVEPIRWLWSASSRSCDWVTKSVGPIDHIHVARVHGTQSVRTTELYDSSNCTESRKR